jgi:hypothetical protein
VNLAPITEDEELPSRNANDDDTPNLQQQDEEEVKIKKIIISSCLLFCFRKGR